VTRAERAKRLATAFDTVEIAHDTVNEAMTAFDYHDVDYHHLAEANKHLYLAEEQLLKAIKGE
jgi:hypothetical protein